MSNRYAVIVCPKCGQPIGADMQKRTMTCPCGFEIELLKMKPRFSSSSPVEVANAVAQARAQATEGKMDLPKDRPRKSRMGRIAERAKDIKDTQERLAYIAVELTKAKKEFSIEDLEKLQELVGRESAEDMLVGMRDDGIVFESSKNRYRAV